MLCSRSQLPLAALAATSVSSSLSFSQAPLRPPVGPVSPTRPLGPVSPVGPTAPAGPTGPVSPVGPVGPACRHCRQRQATLSVCSARKVGLQLPASCIACQAAGRIECQPCRMPEAHSQAAHQLLRPAQKGPWGLQSTWGEGGPAHAAVFQGEHGSTRRCWASDAHVLLCVPPGRPPPAAIWAGDCAHQETASQPSYCPLKTLEVVRVECVWSSCWPHATQPASLHSVPPDTATSCTSALTGCARNAGSTSRASCAGCTFGGGMIGGLGAQRSVSAQPQCTKVALVYLNQFRFHAPAPVPYSVHGT